jgi:hypothetical protein
MAAARQTRARTAPTGTPRDSVRALERRIARLEARLKAVQSQHARELATVQRAGDRRIAALVREITGLRHHEARAEALARVLGEREAMLSAQADRVAQLETLLQVAPR